MVKIVMIPCGLAYRDNKLIFSFFLNMKKVFSLIGFGISFHNFNNTIKYQIESQIVCSCS